MIALGRRIGAWNDRYLIPALCAGAGGFILLPAIVRVSRALIG